MKPKSVWETMPEELEVLGRLADADQQDARVVSFLDQVSKAPVSASQAATFLRSIYKSGCSPGFFIFATHSLIYRADLSDDVLKAFLEPEWPSSLLSHRADPLWLLEELAERCLRDREGGLYTLPEPVLSLTLLYYKDSAVPTEVFAQLLKRGCAVKAIHSGFLDYAEPSSEAKRDVARECKVFSPPCDC